jgi:hypothetical protein
MRVIRPIPHDPSTYTHTSARCFNRFTDFHQTLDRLYLSQLHCRASVLPRLSDWRLAVLVNDRDFDIIARHTALQLA